MSGLSILTSSHSNAFACLVLLQTSLAAKLINLLGSQGTTVLSLLGSCSRPLEYNGPQDYYFMPGAIYVSLGQLEPAHVQNIPPLCNSGQVTGLRFLWSP